MNDLSALTSNAMSMLSRARATNATKQVQEQAGNSEDSKIKRSASEFESILLGTWLQSAEQSFASVPGSDEDEDQDPCKGQYQNFAIQAVATAITKSGGLGIAPMIASSLSRSQHSSETAPAAEAGAERLSNSKKINVKNY